MLQPTMLQPAIRQPTLQQPTIRRLGLSWLLFVMLFVITACNGGGNDSAQVPPAGPSAELTRTSYGVVHIRAADFAGIGFGLAYAYAQDNICMLADSLLTVRGERSRYFGGDAMPTDSVHGEYSVVVDYLNLHNFNLRNEDSDFFFKAYLDPSRLRASYAGGGAETRALLSGYVAGYNSYVREHAGKLPAACRGAAWVKPITVDDVYLMIAEKALHASGQLFATEILAAARDEPRGTMGGDVRAPTWTAHGLGSNAIALGAETSVDGRGMLLANPHYPWFNTDRFYQVHLTVPGVYDVMGVSLGGIPIVVIGFNKDVAWTHTVTKAAHFTTFRLQLDSSDPTGMTYLVDGIPQSISERVVEVQSLQADGTLRTKRKIFRETPFGMEMAAGGLPLGGNAIVVLADPNRHNTRLVDQWIAMGKARNTAALRAALGRMGLPWVNTVAADRHGDTLYADYSVVPHVVPEKFAPDCLLFAPLLMFDGSRSHCHWGQDSGAPPGIFGSASAPVLMRRDYVSNSNDSYWLTNSRQLLTGPGSGYSPLYGPVGVPQHLRTRLAFVELDQRLEESGRLSMDDLQALLFSNRVHAAELVLPDLLAACGGTADQMLAGACAALAAWDRKVDAESRGAILFREFWLQASESPAFLSASWAVPFDPADPVNTPRGIAPTAFPPLLAMLRATAARLGEMGIPLDAPLGEYQTDVRNGGRYPIHGGIGDVDGVLNALHTKSSLTEEGYRGVAWGTSYVQLVGFDDHGPVARGMLAYGQSTDPASPYYADQLPLYGSKRLVPLPFTQEQILADGNVQRSTVSDK
ncbi:penicillin acylase family protein [Pseudoduganella sp. SL102]|uniref:penicillin acylase family protein n=1 Tax=Pseudoduganella sp. SL102 TaxID=2995154 RepID=UPI00248B2533|nr:penicillin acylase family protein [Pseudoduganella sp. SL102]WBS03746.1 penicillin acylase family protein [Pseudoduganella sp. SL102]